MIIISTFVLILVSIMLNITLRLGADELLRYTQDKEIQLLGNYTNIISANLTTVDNLSNQILFDSRILDILRSDPQEPDYAAIKAVLLNNERYDYYNQYIESIYLFDPVHPYVLSDEMVYKDRFLDPDVLTGSLYTSTGLKPVRKINRSTQVSPQKDLFLLTYVKQSYNYSAGLPVTIVINLYPDEFTSVFDEAEHNSSFFLLDSQCRPLYSHHGEDIPEDEILSRLIPQLEAMGQSENSRQYSLSLNQGNYFVCCQFIPGWCYYTVSIQNHTNFSSNNFMQLVRKLTAPFIAVLLFCFFVIMIISWLLYRPFAGLYNQKEDLEQRYTVTKTYAEPYSIHEFLASSEFDENAFLQLCHDLELPLEQPFFYLLLFRFRQSVSHKTRESYFDAINQLFTGSFCSIMVTDSHNITVLLNTSLPYEELFLQVMHLKEYFNRHKCTVMMGISSCFREIQHMPQYYHNALKKMREWPFTDLYQAEIVNLTPQDAAGSFAIAKPPLDLLLTKLSAQDRDGTLKVVLELLNAFLAIPIDHSPYVKYLIFEIESSIYEHCVSLGVSYDDSVVSAYQLYEEIQEIDDMVSLRHHLLSLLEQSLDRLKLKNHTQKSDIAHQVLQYINEHYSSNISIMDIADSVHLSSNYLSNLFKAEQKETILETLTKVRMKHAVKLLEDPELRIKDIAGMVGYNTTQSFTRYFKKYYLVTPEQWRRNKLK